MADSAESATKRGLAARGAHDCHRHHAVCKKKKMRKMVTMAESATKRGLAVFGINECRRRQAWRKPFAI